jgi:long-subunit acyl-CoA synthetase (AMP-forming)
MDVPSMRASTIPEAFLRQVSSRPDDIFVQVWKQHQGVMDEITWKSFALRVSASCAVLTSFGVVRGTHVAFLCHNSVDCYVFSMANLFLGGVNVNLNWRQPADTVAVRQCCE